MAARVRAFDWSRTPLGPMDQWPQSLRTAVGICLNSPMPMFVWWGQDDLINIYNDAYAPVLGKRHPEALGQPAHQVWSDIWTLIAEDVEAVVRRGTPVTRERVRFVMERNGYPEETYFTYSHSPIPDDHGGIGGLFQVCSDETARVQAEQARQDLLSRLAHQAHVFDTALSHINDFAYTFDRDGRFTYVNKPLLDLWGLPLEEAVGKNFFDLKYPNDLATKLHRQIQQVIDSKHVLVDETPYISPSGVPGYYEYIFSPVLGPDGSVEEVAGSTRVITARKQLEVERERLLATLENERWRLGAIIEQAPAFICTLRGPEHVFELANQRYYEIVGRRDLVGKPVRDALPEVEGQGFFELLDNVYRTGETFGGDEMPVLLRRKDDGSLDQRFMNLVYQAMRETDGSVSGVFVHGVDVTELVRSREALRASEERYRRLVETAHEGIWTIDADGRTTYVNQRMADLLGYAPQEMMGRVHTDFMWEHDRPKGDGDMEDRREGTAEVWDQRYRRKDGSELWTVASCNGLFDAEGKFAGALGMFTDITRRKRAEAERQALLDRERVAREEAESANRAKDRFLAVLSHELRTPLTPVALTAAAMEMDPSLPYEFREDVAMIRRNVELETSLIDDLLDLSRVASGKLRLNPQPTHVHDLIRNVLQIVGPELHEKQLRVEQHLAAAQDRVDADAARLQQTLWNLLKNAAKFTPAGGRIAVRTRNADGQVLIEIADTGIGIAPAALPHVFNPFEQGDAAVTRQYGGMGLGLAIAKAVVDLHGGIIRAASDGPGKGAVFAVALPLGTSVAPGDPDRAEHATSRDNRPFRLLLVEDHADSARILMRLLQRQGTEVQCAGTVAAALQLAASESFDVVISDLGLPDGTGYELMRELRRQRPVVGIAMSGYGMEDDIRRSREAGFVEHLVKPVNLAQLQTAIRRVMSSDQAEAAQP